MKSIIPGRLQPVNLRESETQTALRDALLPKLVTCQIRVRMLKLSWRRHVDPQPVQRLARPALAL